MIIQKLASDQVKYKRNMLFFNNARTAFKSFLESLDFNDGEIVLLPAYIGRSAREGSGVFDPVSELNLDYAFYAVDEMLCIDLDSLEQCLRTHKVRLMLIIHYFGYIDPRYDEAISLATRYNALVLEDEAHALYTDMIGGKVGRLCNATIFSLHKMLPLPDGGILCLNGSSFEKRLKSCDQLPINLLSYDFISIAHKRIANARLLAQMLKPHSDEVVLLRPELHQGEIPQTFPILIRNVSRDELYERLNEAGYGVVTLYHTIIDEIDREKYPDTYNLSKRILNLPVHQDVEPETISGLVDCLLCSIEELKDCCEDV